MIEERFRRLIEASAIATILMDPDGRIFYANRAMCDMLGYDAETLLTMSWRDVTAPEHRFSSREAIEDVMAGRKDSCRINWQYIHAEGRRFWGQVTVSCMRGSDGAVELLIGQVVDITDQFELRAKQAESDARFRRMMENSSVGMSLNAPDGRFVEVNEALCDMLGYDQETLCTKTWQEVTGPETLEADIRRTNDLAAGLIDQYRTTKQFVHADGHGVWVYLSVSCLRSPDGELELFVAEMVDVTTQVELRAKQAEADARFRRLMETSNVGMALATPDGRFDVVNKALCDMLGYDEATLKTKTWQGITPARYMESDIKNVEDLLEGRLDTYRVIKEHIHADGHGVWTDLSVSCLRDPDGAVQYLAGQLIDISEEVEAQERLAQQEKENRLLAGRLQAEMRDAADYVESVLPGDLHGLVEVSSRYFPALDLGGDVFHYLWLDDDHLEIYLIDVSGHGIRPALLSMSIHNLIRTGSLPTATLLSPDHVLTKLNSLFQMDDHGGGYFTIWYGIYQHSTRTLRYASAGHPPALALHRGGHGVTATSLCTPANPIGMFPDSVYASDSYTVPSGGQLLLYSDGAFELVGDSGAAEPFFLGDFVTLCTELAARPDWSLDGLVDRLRALSPGGDFDDDCALVLLTFP